jgi:hypothetical protein
MPNSELKAVGLLLALALLFAAPLVHGSETEAAEEQRVLIQPPDADGYSEVNWDALIPSDWRPDKLLAEYNVNEISDDDPRAVELMEKLMALWRDAPVVEEMDGRKIRLPGFVVPLKNDGEKISQFLLVPYYGACIHVPPPPANQTIVVTTAKGKEYRGKLFDTIWVKGVLQVKPVQSELADAGYSIQADAIEEYRLEDEQGGVPPAQD